MACILPNDYQHCFTFQYLHFQHVSHFYCFAFEPGIASAKKKDFPYCISMHESPARDYLHPEAAKHIKQAISNNWTVAQLRLILLWCSASQMQHCNNLPDRWGLFFHRYNFSPISLQAGVGILIPSDFQAFRRHWPMRRTFQDYFSGRAWMPIWVISPEIGMLWPGAWQAVGRKPFTDISKRSFCQNESYKPLPLLLWKQWWAHASTEEDWYVCFDQDSAHKRSCDLNGMRKFPSMPLTQGFAYCW